MADMAENRLTHHQIPREEFEREMTMVLLELKEEFSPERVEARLTEYNAALPPPPRIPRAVGGGPRWDLKGVSLYQTQLLEKPPEPLSALNKEAIPKVAVASGGRNLCLSPLLISSKRTVTLPGAIWTLELTELKKAELTKVALPKRSERAESSVESTQERMENKPPRFQVAIYGAKLQKEGMPLKLGAVRTVAVLGASAAKLVVPLTLPTKRSVAVPTVSPPKEIETLSLRCPSKFQLPKPVERKELEPLALNKPTGVVLSQVMPRERTKPLRLQIFFHVAVSSGATSLNTTKLILTARRKIPMPKAAPQPKKTSLDARYPGKVALPCKVSQCRAEPLDLDKPGKTVISAVKPMGEPRPLELKVLAGVEIPGRAAACTGVSLALPGKRRVALREPSLPNEDRNMKVEMLDELNKVPITRRILQKKLLWVVPKTEAWRVQRPRPVNMGTMKRLQVETPKDNRKWFDLTPKDFQKEEIVIPTGEPRENITLEQVPNIMELWERIDGPVALIADFGRV